MSRYPPHAVPKSPNSYGKPKHMKALLLLLLLIITIIIRARVNTRLGRSYLFMSRARIRARILLR